MAAAKGSGSTVSVNGIEVRVSSLDRPMWVEGADVITKGDLIGYYRRMASVLLRQLQGRPTTMQRFPDGVIIEGQARDSFYNKHLPKSAPAYVDSATVTFPSGRTGVQLCPENEASIVWAANQGCVTFHPWPVHSALPDDPDELRLDLDPQPGTGFAEAVSAAVALRELLREVGLDPYVKTSGGRGLHVFCAIEPRWEFLEVRHAAIALGRELERRRPDLVTTAWWKEERGARVFVDYNQMARDRTMASAWSLRPRMGAPVSTPLTWDELGGIDPSDLTIGTVPDRLAALGDPWERLGDSPGSLDGALAMWQEDFADRGLGEMPFPPDYPKMPGEPPRVQPSRKRVD